MKPLIPTRNRLLLISGFLLAFFVVLSFSTYVLYTRSKDHLDTALGERLRSIAVTLSHAVEISTAGMLEVGDFDPELHTLLHTARAENLLSNIVIVTPEGNTIVDLANVSVTGELNPFIELDYTAVTLARSGLSASTNLYRAGDDYMKSAYAPITGPDGEVAGLLGVEAGATYFDVLRALSNAIILINVVSALVIIVLGVFFYHQSASLDRAQATIIQGENLATMGRMVAGIAHEIRNPLSILKTSSERLARKYNPDDEVFSYISEEVDKLDDIVTGYLGFARAERQPFAPHPIQRIARRCLLILETDIKDKDISVRTEFPDEDVVVMGDDKRLQQAILNVLLNAVQAVDAGGSIKISLESGAKSAIVVIKDDGAGISDKNLREITKPFFTTKEKGSGLGMSIVNAIAQEHSGTLDIRSTLGDGTQVTLEIPLAAR
jgi:signal transduction histidine kinase